MAKFGTIHNWLDYDSIRMAGVTKEMANIVGRSIGAASVLGGEVVDQAFRNYEAKEKGSSNIYGDDETSLQKEDELISPGNTGGSDEENESDGDPNLKTNPTDTPEEASNKVSFKEAYKDRDPNLYFNLTLKEFIAEANRQKNGGKVPTEQMKGSLGDDRVVEGNTSGEIVDVGNNFNTYEGAGLNSGAMGLDGNFISSTPIGLPSNLTPGQKTLLKIKKHFSDMSTYVPEISRYSALDKYIKKLSPAEQNVFAKSIGKESWLDLDSLTLKDFNTFTKGPTKRLNLTDSSSKAPFPRLSPLGRYRETPLNQMQDMLEYGTISEASMPEYLGEIGKAAGQGYNKAIQKFNYNLKVQKQRLKGINEQYSSLKVDPTGLSSLDANLKILGKGMQGAYMELMSKKNSMNPFDFMQEKQKLLEQPVIINQAIKTLQQRVKDFNDNRYEVGQATDSRTIDILDTLSKGGGDLKPIYKDGVPYLVGTTLGDENVEVAISEIANGNNDFKFIKSETVQPFIDDIIKDYTATEKYYTEGGGIMERKKLRPGWEQVATSKFKEDLKMKGEPGMRGYAALFGTNFDGYNKMLEQGEDIEGFLVDSFLNRVNQEFQPYAQAVQTGQLRPTTASTTQSERNIAKIKADLDKLPPLSSSTLSSYASQLDKKIYELKKDPKTGSFYINDFKNKRRINLPSDPIEAKTEIAGYAGVTGYSQAGQLQDVSQYNFDL